MRIAFIDAEKASFPVSRMCDALGVSQSGFFAWKGRPASRRQREDIVYLAYTRTAFELSNETLAVRACIATWLMTGIQSVAVACRV